MKSVQTHHRSMTCWCWFSHILKIRKFSGQNFNWAINTDDTIAYGAVLRCAALSRFSDVPLFVTLQTAARQAPLFMEFSRQYTRMGYHTLLQGIFPTQGLNPWLLHLLHWQVGSLPLAPPGKALLMTQLFRKPSWLEKNLTMSQICCSLGLLLFLAIITTDTITLPSRHEL